MATSHHIKFTFDDFLNFIEMQPDEKRLRLRVSEYSCWDSTVRWKYYQYTIPLFKELINWSGKSPVHIRGTKNENLVSYITRKYNGIDYIFENEAYDVDTQGYNIYYDMMVIINTRLYEHKYSRIDHITYGEVKTALVEAVKHAYNYTYESGVTA